MPRSKNNVAAHKRHKKVLKRARGNYGARSRLYRTALETVNKGLMYAYRDRRAKKRVFRSLWIARISAAAKMCDTNYSSFMHGLTKAGVNLNRKALADIAARDMATFTNLAKIASGN
ncbi:MAG: 50S ribosomal protein L20 [candidate division Zixibacteria bacterium]|jgi:large subunit ribosomal protein L20|nr:50S ribosomal protein L20 [candidate division Zixibacteria bacterium]